MDTKRICENEISPKIKDKSIISDIKNYGVKITMKILEDRIRQDHSMSANLKLYFSTCLSLLIRDQGFFNKLDKQFKQLSH